MLTKRVPTMNIDLDTVKGFIDTDVVILHDAYYQRKNGKFRVINIAQIKQSGNRYYIHKLQPTGGSFCVGKTSDRHLVEVYRNTLKNDGYVFITPNTNIYKLVSNE